MRSPDAVDYSIPVLQWLKETTTDRANSGNHQGEALGSFKMEDHTFADLSVRLGVQYRFVHQGQCEHVLKFERVRVAGSLWKQPTDGDGNMFRYEMNYPVTTYTLKPRAQKCGVCTLYAAKYAVHDSAILIETPAFLCEICFDSLHRDASGNIILEVGPKFQVESFP
ncbi:hypothetical protein SARC_09530 [Sphaeroforma arctica JP610]|uniref:snRNA-activating protein complex subunit 3 n=1 Tax=Sphaeroforma arctica JP610 TaxID=667725 RepID=A0A0L0FMM6_9EUKA|nr:hypothetical protein SARC_09530 [Sphaeroforma arctica JP610]KNC78019.1 hypothetical protein SARC_09530 [Sphaeroforma arctica JP610]|eukprot:XP_014151921.1 hypothetical protein SARC_09530 [Sphaeroforma arctica JP610]